MIDDDNDGNGDVDAAFGIQYEYNSLQKAKEAIYADVKAMSYEISIKESYVDRRNRQRRRCDIECDRSATYKARRNIKPHCKGLSSMLCL